MHGKLPPHAWYSCFHHTGVCMSDSNVIIKILLCRLITTDVAATTARTTALVVGLLLLLLRPLAPSLSTTTAIIGSSYRSIKHLKVLLILFRCELLEQGLDGLAINITEIR